MITIAVRMIATLSASLLSLLAFSPIDFAHSLQRFFILGDFGSLEVTLAAFRKRNVVFGH